MVINQLLNLFPHEPETENLMTEEIVEDVDALDLFKSEMRSEDLSIRIDCISHLDVIAHALGKSKALTTLVPLISDCVKGVFCTDDDEVLLSFAKYIPNMVPYLPEESGSLALVPILESLASQDETVIREAAVDALGKIARVSPPVCAQSCFPALIRLFKADWFSSKLSACGFAHYVYPFVSDENKSQIRSLYISCANDETPMVKRAAAAHLYELLAVVEKPSVIAEFVPVYQTLSQDETQESVRSSCVAASLVLCRMFDVNESRQLVRDTVAALAMDKSWRVRLAVAKVFGELCKCIGRESMVSHLLDPLLALMRDQEPDVRKAAVGALQETASLLTANEVVTAIVPLFPVICRDPVQQVRSALSSCIGPLAKTLGKEFTITHLLPLLMDLVKDEHPTIRYNATGSIGIICQVLNGSADNASVNQLVALLHTLSLDTNWRTRLAVLEQIPTLCELLGKELFESKLESLFLSFFGDSVHAIRAALTAEIGKLVEQLGDEWTVNHFVNKVLTLYSETNSYSSRIAILQTLPKLAAAIANPEDTKRLLIPVLEKGCRDAVPNVRFIACAVVRELLGVEDSAGAVGQVIRASVEPLVKDIDMDVRYFAGRAVEGASR